jgi:hypothetical protein
MRSRNRHLTCYKAPGVEDGKSAVRPLAGGHGDGLEVSSRAGFTMAPHSWSAKLWEYVL